MKPRIPTILLSLSSAILIFGGAMHALAFVQKAASVIGSANVAPFFASELKVLWLADSTTLVLTGGFFAFIAIKPSAASRLVVILVAAVPAATTVLLYSFLGNFYAAHLLAVASAMAIAAALLTDAPAVVGAPRRQA